MAHDLPSLAGAEWLKWSGVERIFALLGEAGEAVRAIGGAVRNTLLDRPVRDVDFATTALPAKVTALAEAAGVKAVPTGIEHGTVTLVVGGRGFEVTTLREDVETDGRHAVVRFGRDWEGDARRRDFTVNALSVDADGRVHDPVGGYPDILARRIRFIGDADRRIAEDRLRILRFFRFHAEYATGDLDPAGLSAAIRARHGIAGLSAERVGQEMRRLVVAPGAPATVSAMQDAGVLPVVLAGVGYVGAFARVAGVEKAAGAVPVAATRLAVLACRIAEDVERVTGRLRLANAERDRVAATLAAAGRFMPFPDLAAARRLLYRLGPEAFRDGVVHGFAWSVAPPGPAWRELYHLPDEWTAPVFPLTGGDVLAEGVAPGSEVGRLLRQLEGWWLERAFLPDAAALRARLREIVAASRDVRDE